MKRFFPLLTVILSLSCVSFAAGDNAAPDNTARNERDRSGNKATPIDQSNNPEDLKITQAIRQAVMKDSGLSMTAKNVKIITANGNIVLRGPVNTEEEKAKIEQHAKTSAGTAKVDNQLEVKK